MQVLLLFIIISSSLIAQNLEIDLNSVAKLNKISDKITVTDPPKFACGIDGLNYFIKKNAKISHNEECNKCEVSLSFLILKDGTVEDVQVVRGINHIYDLEAIRLCKIMPKWKPALINGKPAVVKVTMPIALK